MVRRPESIRRVGLLTPGERERVGYELSRVKRFGANQVSPAPLRKLFILGALQQHHYRHLRKLIVLGHVLCEGDASGAAGL